MKKIIVLFALLSIILFSTPIYALSNGTILKSITVQWDGSGVASSDYVKNLTPTDQEYIFDNIDKLSRVYTVPSTFKLVVNGTGAFVADVTIDSFIVYGPSPYRSLVIEDSQIGLFANSLFTFSMTDNPSYPGLTTTDQKFVAANLKNRFQDTTPITIYFEFSGGPTNWWVDESAPFIIPNGTELNYEQIISVLVSINWISVDQVPAVTFLSSDYFGNENVPGTYTLNLSIDGVHTTFKLRVTDNGDTNIEPPPVNLSDNQQDDWLGWLGVAIIIVSCFSYIIYLNIDIYRKKK